MPELIKGHLRELIPYLERPPHLSSASKIRASNDVEALERFLDEYFDKATTYRSYKKECERFLVWCVSERRVNLSTLDRDDVEAYINFLKDPSPREKWCGPRSLKKGHTNKTWAPFSGPLGESAIKTALAILNSMMTYLVDARYLDFNPFALIRKKSRFKKDMADQSFSIQERILNQDELSLIVFTIDSEDESDDLKKLAKARLKFLFDILFYLGLRIDELAKSNWSACQKHGGKWWFYVRGKGDRLGKVPINNALLSSVMAYRICLNKSPLPFNDEDPIICSLKKSEQALSTRQISNLVKDIAHKSAEQISDNPRSQEKLRKFSPHWLRHLSASRQDLAGISFTNIKENLRHQNEQTTRHYVHAFDDERHQEMEKLRFK